MKNKKEKVSLWLRIPAYLPVTAWSIMIMVLMGIPGTVVPDLPDFMDLFEPDKIIHLFLFAILVISAFFCKERYRVSNSTFSFPAILAYCTAYGAITEVLQYEWFINRQASFWDFVSDTVGVITGAYIYRCCIEKKLKLLILNSKSL